jgi:predicted short-subunit dehydrogenase-like oxidoreductase (DUF2520 family)
MKFSIVGTGNAAWHLTHMLMDADHTLLQVYARSAEKAEEFAAYFEATVVEDPSLFSDENDLIIIAVSDKAIHEVAEKISLDRCVAHTSGSTSLDVLVQTKKAVIWPLQTLTEGVPLDYTHIPICIEAADEALGKELHAAFSQITSKCFLAGTDQRIALHMAAVWSNNFTNYMYRVAEHLCEVHEVDFTLLWPLIEETAFKIKETSPLEAQTGPASRGDLTTIRKHMEMLRDNKQLSELYRIMSEHIMNNRNGF